MLSGDIFPAPEILASVISLFIVHPPIAQTYYVSGVKIPVYNVNPVTYNLLP